MTKLYRSASLMLAAALGFSSVGCENKAQTGALVGAGTGAAIGAGIGSLSHSSAGVGAAIGAGAGLLGGYIVGNEMDKKDQKDREQAYEHSTRSSRNSRYDETATKITKNDVINWTKDGVKDEVIIDRIERSGVVFKMRATDENALRDAGVSEEVIRAMKNTNRR